MRVMPSRGIFSCFFLLSDCRGNQGKFLSCVVGLFKTPGKYVCGVLVDGSKCKKGILSRGFLLECIRVTTHHNTNCVVTRIQTYSQHELCCDSNTNLLTTRIVL